MDKLPELKQHQFYFHEVIGFKVIEKSHGDIGNIQDIFDNKSQPIFQILDAEKEILIPFHESFFVKIDRDTKELHLECPDGLIEMYKEG